MNNTTSITTKSTSINIKQFLPVCHPKSKHVQNNNSLPLHQNPNPLSHLKNNSNIITQRKYKKDLENLLNSRSKQFSHSKQISNLIYKKINDINKGNLRHISVTRLSKPRIKVEPNTTASTGNKKNISFEKVNVPKISDTKDKTKRNLHKFSFHLIPVSSNKASIINYTNNAIKKNNIISINKQYSLNSSSSRKNSNSISRSKAKITKNNDGIVSKAKTKIKKANLIPINPKNKTISTSSSINNNNNNNNNSKRNSHKHIHYINNNQSNTYLNTLTISPKNNQTYRSSCPQDVFEYIDDIYNNLLIEEQNYCVSNTKINPLYMTNQKFISIDMRCILVNWLIEVHFQLQYKDSTLFLCISLIDRYLSYNTVERVNYQLLGIAALFISCKQEEISIPNPKDFLFLTENAYTLEQMFSMENELLHFTNFYLLIPTTLDFLMIHIKKQNLSNKEKHFALYLITCVLNEYKLLKYTNSIISCAVMYITHKFFSKNNYQLFMDSNLYTLPNNNNNNNYKHSEIFKQCILDICYCVDTTSNSEYTATKIKFENEIYNKVSLLIPNK